MKYTIKPIIWVDTNFFTGVGSCCSIGAYWLQVRPTRNIDEPFKWRIQQGSLVINEGKTDTLEQGQIWCEREWQNYLFVNFLDTAL